MKKLINHNSQLNSLKIFINLKNQNKNLARDLDLIQKKRKNSKLINKLKYKKMSLNFQKKNLLNN